MQFQILVLGNTWSTGLKQSRKSEMPTNTTPSIKKKISVASAKAKGRRLQQWVRDFLRSNLPE
jgi:hypothetical protein